LPERSVFLVNFNYLPVSNTEGKMKLLTLIFVTVTTVGTGQALAQTRFQTSPAVPAFVPPIAMPAPAMSQPLIQSAPALSAPAIMAPVQVVPPSPPSEEKKDADGGDCSCPAGQKQDADGWCWQSTDAQHGYWERTQHCE
jgi:hypothetical protein